MKNWILYIVILLIGVTIGLGGRALFSSPETTTQRSSASEHSADDGHGHGTTSTADWCAEHRVPESECTNCNPDLIAQFKSANDWCGEHNLPESHCRLCNPDLHFPQEPVEMVNLIEPMQTSVFYPANATDCATNNAVIQFASAKTAERAGLTTEPALEFSGDRFVEAPAEVRFDDTKTTLLTLSEQALVSHWLVEPGERISKDEPLATLESPEIARLQAEYLEASASLTVSKQALERGKSLFARDLLSQAELEQLESQATSAEAHLAGVRGMLLTGGFDQQSIHLLDSTHTISQRFTLRAVSSGVLIERRAPIGELLEAGTPLARIGNPTDLWLEAHVRERDLPAVHLGQRVEFSTDGGGMARTAGEIIWVSNYLNEDTRTGTIRARLQRSDDNISANLFGRAKILTGDSTSVAMVSRDAVQWEGCCNVVFVQEAIDRYRPRKVTIARGDNDHYRVLAGVMPGERIVVDGSYLLKTELKKGSIGAGCCGLEAK